MQILYLTENVRFHKLLFQFQKSVEKIHDRNNSIFKRIYFSNFLFISLALSLLSLYPVLTSVSSLTRKPTDTERSKNGEEFWPEPISRYPTILTIYPGYTRTQEGYQGGSGKCSLYPPELRTRMKSERRRLSACVSKNWRWLTEAELREKLGESLESFCCRHRVRQR